MGRKMKVIIVSPTPAQQFVLNDSRALGQWHDVTLFNGLRGKNLKTFYRCIRETDFVLCWFGCRAAALAVFLSKLAKKRTAIIAGGQDVAYVQEIRHGMMGKIGHRGFIKYAFTNCDAVLAVSKFSAAELLRWARPRSLCVIYNGVDVPLKIIDPEAREGVLCIARITRETIELKGIEHLLKAARLLPHVPFTLVGHVSKDGYNRIQPLLTKNVKLTGALKHESVLSLCSTAKVYVQPSYYESFGVGLVEAMAAGCVPVVTRAGALPEVVDDTGFYIPFGDEYALAQAVENAMQFTEMGLRARDRVLRCFTLQRRAESINRLIDEMIYHRKGPDDLILRNHLGEATNSGRTIERC